MSARKKSKSKRKKAQAQSRKGSARKSKREKAKSRKKSGAKKPNKSAPKAKGKALAKKGKKDKAKAKKEKAQKLKLKQERERERAAQAKARERERREREREGQQRKREQERAKAAAKKERDREQREREKQKQRDQKQRELEKRKKEAEREAARVAQQKERQAAKDRAIREREAERERLKAEKEAAREEARRIKEEERARRDAEREAYRKAKEAERERLRAEKEAARRALEGKVARASRRAQLRDGLGRGITTRVYRPDAIPNQSGTTRRNAEPPLPGQPKLVGVRLPDLAHGAEPAPTAPEPPRAPTPPPAPTISVEERWAAINERLNRADAAFQREYRESFDMSWVYHDSALEGVVYTFQELKAAIDPSTSIVADSGMQPVCDEIRRHRQAIDYVRELAEKRRVPINVDTIKKIYVILHPEEGDIKTVKYRKDIPQHRLYFHEYAAPDKIAYKVRQVIDWLNGPEPKKIKSPIRIASRIHYDLLRVFPFAHDSGKVSRLLMNLLLMRAGHPPAIIHSTERQRYYEALKGQLPIIVSMVNDSITNALLSIEKRIEEYEGARARLNAPEPPTELPN